MKKFLFLFLFLFPITCYAYTIDNYIIDITVLDNGDLNVYEIIDMDGEYNGFEKVIYYKDIYKGYIGSIISSIDDVELYNSDKVVLNEIRAIDYNNFSIDKLSDTELFKKVNKAKKGDYGIYTDVSTTGGRIYKIYNSSEMGKDLYINYSLKNVGITHIDVSEILFNFDGIDENIKNLYISIHVLNNKDVLDVYSHNVSYSNITSDKENILLTYTNVDKKNDIDLRIVCDKNDSFNKVSKEVVYDKIIEIEKNLNEIYLEDRDYEYEKLKIEAYDAVSKAFDTLLISDYENALNIVSLLKEDDNLKVKLIVKLMDVEAKITRKNIIIKVSLTSIIYIWLIGIVVIGYQVYRKHNKKYKAVIKEKKLSDIPSLISCFKVGYLIRKSIDDRDLVASLIRLIDNGNILYKKMKDDNFSLTIVNTSDLSESDLKLIKFLFDGKEEITYNKLRQCVLKNYSVFLDNYSNWITKATIEAEEMNYYEDLILAKVIGLIYSISGFVLGIVLSGFDTYISSYYVSIIAFLSIIYFIFLRLRTLNGNEEFFKWIAFKKYLNTSYKIDVNEFNDPIWNKKVMYSISLGNYSKLSKRIIRKLTMYNIDSELVDFISMCDDIDCGVRNVISYAYKSKKDIIA